MLARPQRQEDRQFPHHAVEGIARLITNQQRSLLLPILQILRGIEQGGTADILHARADKLAPESIRAPPVKHKASGRSE